MSINEYITSLSESKKPNLILASIFKLLFERNLKKNEWGILGKYTNVYGRWFVLEALLRASANANLVENSENVWPYITAILVEMVHKEIKETQYKLAEEQKLQKTLDFIREMSKKHDVKIKDKDAD